MITPIIYQNFKTANIITPTFTNITTSTPIIFNSLTINARPPPHHHHPYHRHHHHHHQQQQQQQLTCEQSSIRSEPEKPSVRCAIVSTALLGLPAAHRRMSSMC